MKILCLHGMGTNSEILKAQTASFRRLLPSHFTFDFIEGENDCSAAEGIAEVYPEPYICWYPFPPTTDNVASAHELVWDIIKEDGPFDGVMGFSQGAALAASILLDHEKKSPLEPAPFRFAIFICGSLPFSIDEGQGYDLTEAFAKCNDPMPGDILEWKRLVCLEREAIAPVPQTQTTANGHHSLTFFPRLDTRTFLEESSSDDSASDSQSDNGSEPRSPETPLTPFSPSEGLLQGHDVAIDYFSDKFQQLSVTKEIEGRIYRFHPSIDTSRISIPTTHIYGRHDPYYSQSLELVKMCQKDLVSILDHGGAHDIPRSEWANKAIADAIEKTVTKSEFML